MFLSIVLISITSPLSNLPSIDLIPAGRRLLPFFKALVAPSSIIKLPTGFIVPAIHCLRAASGVLLGTNHVQGLPLNREVMG